MRIYCTALLFVLLYSTTVTTVEGFSVGGGRGIRHFLAFLYPRVVVAAPLTMTNMTEMKTRCMVSKYWSNYTHDNGEYKKC